MIKYDEDYGSSQFDVEKCRESADSGYFIAQYNYGKYCWDMEDKERGWPKAVFYWRKAAEKGHPDAQFLLGDCYFDGTGGLEPDRFKAKELWEKAASKGHEQAKLLLLQRRFR